MNSKSVTRKKGLTHFRFHFQVSTSAYNIFHHCFSLKINQETGFNLDNEFPVRLSQNILTLHWLRYIGAAQKLWHELFCQLLKLSFSS